MGIERGKFITVHGIDGTGKTTTARAVQAEAAARGHDIVNYDEHPDRALNPHSARKDALDRAGEDLESRLIAHLESTLYHSDQIEKLLAEGYHVVKSRYLDDVMAHFAHLGVSEEKLHEISSKFPIVQPDLKVILTVDDATRLNRTGEREDATSADREAKIPGSRAHFFEEYIQRAAEQAGDARTFDTGTFDSESIARAIVDYIVARP